LSHTRRCQFGPFLLLVYLCPIVTYAVFEDIQIGLSQPHEIPLRWDNVKEPPIWVDGAIPEANSEWGLYQVELEAEEFVTVWLAEGEWLRIRHPREDFLADALEVAVSYGTGLYTYVPVFAAEQGKSLLLTPDLNMPRLVRITLAPQQSESVAMALFTSRHKQIPEIVPLYQEIPLSEDRVTLQFTYQTMPGSQIPITEMEFGYLEKHAPVMLKVQGPTQLSLETRVIYPPADSVLQQAYRLSILLNGKVMRFLEFETTVDNQQLISIQGNPVVLGRSEMTYLKIPEGEHELQINSSANLYARLISKEPKERLEYLYPDFNQFQSEMSMVPENAMPQQLSQFEDTFWHLKANTPVNIKAEGPAKLRLENRFIYPSATHLYQIYRLFIQVNDNDKQTLGFETNSDYQQSIIVNGQSLVLGMPGVTDFTLPAGEHNLQLSSSTDLYVRLKSKTRRHVVHPGYLFPKLNQPQPKINAMTENAVPQWLNDSAWQFTEDELRTLYLTHFDMPESVRNIALRFIRDNSRREGGLLGAMTMFEAARRRPHEARVRNIAKGLLGRHSFYRNLLPWHKQHKASQTFHKFIAYKLRDPTSENQPLVVAEQHQDAYLKRVAGAYFAPIPAYATEPQIYKLPERTVPSLLRVIVKQQKQPQRQTFFVQFDDQTPIRMQVEPYIFEVPSHYYRHAQGEAGLKMLALSHGTDADTLGGPYASRHSLGSLIDASTLVLPLPPYVQKIKVWPPSPLKAKSSATEPLQVALQYRAARQPFRLSETEYLEAASRFGSSYELFQYFVNVTKNLRGFQNLGGLAPNLNVTKNLRGFQNLGGLAPNLNVTKNLRGFQNLGGLAPNQFVYSDDPLSSINDTKQDLYNHWLPLIRFLHAQKKHFIATVYRPLQKKLKVHLSQAELNRLVKQAQQAETDNQWLVALEKWTEVVQGSQGELHNQAQLAREESLEQLGEVFLAKRLLQGLYIDSADPVLAQNAFEKLLKDYQQLNDKSALIPLLATVVLREPTPTLFKQLAHVLTENGYYDYAMMVGMALPPVQRPNALMVEQAYRFGWWQTFENLLPTLSDKEQWLWLFNGRTSLSFWLVANF